MLKNKLLKIFYSTLFIFIALAQKAQAGFLDDTSLNQDCMARGQCSLDDVAAGFISLIRLLLGAISALALVFMIWGGVQWVWSGGNADKVKRGKDIFFNTIAALVLAFGSFMITGLFINDILQPRDAYKIVSEEGGKLFECKSEAVGKPCNLPKEHYVCSGPAGGEDCIKYCDIPRVLYPDILNTEGLTFSCASLNANPGAWHSTNMCPGGNDNVCIMFDNAGAVSIVDYNTNSGYQDVIMSLVLEGWHPLFAQHL